MSSRGRQASAHRQEIASGEFRNAGNFRSVRGQKLEQGHRGDTLPGTRLPDHGKGFASADEKGKIPNDSLESRFMTERNAQLLHIQKRL
jgi:hypothetical protein